MNRGKIARQIESGIDSEYLGVYLIDYGARREWYGLEDGEVSIASLMSDAPFHIHEVVLEQEAFDSDGYRKIIGAFDADGKRIWNGRGKPRKLGRMSNDTILVFDSNIETGASMLGGIIFAMQFHKPIYIGTVTDSAGFSHFCCERRTEPLSFYEWLEGWYMQNLNERKKVRERIYEMDPDAALVAESRKLLNPYGNDIPLYGSGDNVLGEIRTLTRYGARC